MILVRPEEPDRVIMPKVVLVSLAVLVELAKKRAHLLDGTSLGIWMAVVALEATRKT